VALTMKSNETHVLAAQWSRLAAPVEQTLFRIERESRWLAGAVNGAIAGAAVALVAWLVTTLQEGDLLLFACLGSSASSVVFAPLAKNNSLRTIILAYAIAALVCLLLLPIHRHELLPVPLQIFLAVGIPVTVMRLSDTMHPAAIGSALAFIIYDRDMKSLLMLLVAIIGLLTIVKLLAYIYLEDLQFRQFGREFTRRYYGKEMTVTVVSDGAKNDTL
jgi:CBS-domain-containing membrane protein